MRKLVLVAMALFLFPIAIATPYLHDPVPANGTYIYGRNTDIFSINITEANLNTSTVRIYYKVEGPSAWANKTLNCVNISLDKWYCSSTIPGIESLLADGKHLLYYFEANDTSGNLGQNGTVNDPLKVLVDRSPPFVSLYNLLNNSYVGQNFLPKLLINDTYSGVFEAYYLFGNQTWNSSWFKLNETNGYYTVQWDTSRLPNNSSWFIYVNATDFVGNTNTTRVGRFFIDNQKPQISMIFPSEGEGLYAKVSLSLIGYDEYSGIKSSSFSIGNFSDNLACSGTLHNKTCIGKLDTTQFSNGNYSMNFFVTDFANNTEKKSVSVVIDNTNPIIMLISPKTNSYVHGTIPFKIKVGNVRSISSAFLEIGGKQFSLQCLNDTCSLMLDTHQFGDNRYVGLIKVSNEAGYQRTAYINLVIDNTLPTVAITEPYIKNTSLYLNLVALDGIGLDPNRTEFRLSNYEEKMKCNSFVSGKKIVCSYIMNVSNIPNGKYNISFYTYDLAGNEVVKNKTIDIAINRLTNKPNQPAQAVNKTPSVPAPGEKYIYKIVSNKVAYLLGGLIAILIGILILVLFIKPKTKAIQFNVKEKLQSEKNTIQLINNYLYSIRSAKDVYVVKEYLLSIRSMLTEIKPTILVEKILRKLPSPVKEAAMQEFSLEIEELKKKKLLLEQLDALLDHASSSKELNVITDDVVKISELVKKLSDLVDKELDIWKKCKTKYLGV